VAGAPIFFSVTSVLCVLCLDSFFFFQLLTFDFQSKIPALPGLLQLPLWIRTMKNKKPNAEHIWKQCEDLLAPRLRLSITDRVVYSHLLRHSRLEGKPRLRFSIPWLSRGIRLCSNSTRWAVRRLISRGLLRLVQCSKAGHVVEVLLPDEILAAGGDEADRTGGPVSPTFLPAIYSEGEDFLKTAALRRSIHARERGRCFYCLRQLTPQTRCLDHVVPQSQFGGNSYRNLVSCCLQCNSRKGERSALDFLRRLYRERRLSDAELADRLRTLDALAAGKLRPAIAPIANPRRMGRHPINPANP
jgi:hypothetical protein